MSIQTFKNKGQLIYHNNRTLQDIANIMEHPTFKEFFDKYFDDPSIIMLMKLYQQAPSDDPYEKIALVYEAFNNSTLRPCIISTFNNWLANKNTEQKSITN